MAKNNGKNNGNGRNSLTTKQDAKPLSPKDLYLIELLADPEDTRPKEDKALESGYSRKHVYVLEKRPAFATALAQRINENFERIKQGRGQVLQALRLRALAKHNIEISDANKAAELYLKVTGDISTGQNIQVTQIQTNEAETRESRKDRLGGYFADREIITTG